MVASEGEMESLVKFEEETGMDPEAKLDRIWNKMLIGLKKGETNVFINKSKEAEAFITIIFGDRSRDLSKIEDLFKGARRVVLNSGWRSMAFDMLVDIKEILHERGVLISEMI